VLSPLLPLINFLPSGETASEETALLSSVTSLACNCRSQRFHNFTVLSPLAVAKVCPSGECATSVTSLPCCQASRQFSSFDIEE
jgi:hypothetical protein